MTTHKIPLTAALLAAVAGLAACGPGHSPVSMSPAFLHRLNRVCAADFAVMVNTGQTPFPYPDFKPDDPQPAQLPKVGRFFAPNVKVWQRLPGQLDALGEPAAHAAAWDRLRQLDGQLNANGIRQVNAALTGDAHTFTATYHRAHSTYEQIQDAEQKAGLPSSSPCQKVFS